MVGAQRRRRKQCCDPTPEGAQPPQIQVRPSLRLRLTLQGEQLSAFHGTPGRFSPQPLPYWALGQVSPSCQLFSQISNIACVSHGRKRLVFSKLVISRAQLSGAGPKCLGAHEVELKPFAPWGEALGFGFLPDSHGAGVKVCRELVFQLLLPALEGVFFPSPRSFWSQLLGVFYSYFFRGHVSHTVAISLVCL